MVSIYVYIKNDTFAILRFCTSITQEVVVVKNKNFQISADRKKLGTRAERHLDIPEIICVHSLEIWTEFPTENFTSLGHQNGLFTNACSLERSGFFLTTEKYFPVRLEERGNDEATQIWGSRIDGQTFVYAAVKAVCSSSSDFNCFSPLFWPANKILFSVSLGEGTTPRIY